ncbi:hypothetical protein KAI32_02130 [Candidatus Pacearchaeota archaeon]|nr:hypothetical protein [Candidatus Pacearchaeota archaeon]
MRVSYIISGIVIILMILVGVLFVFGDEVLRTADSIMSPEDSSNQENIVEAEEGEGMEETGGAKGVEGSDVGENDFEGSDVGENDFEEVGGSNCKMQQIQYSLRNFKTDVACTDTDANGCIRVVVSCSVEVYSFDKEVDIFGMRYSLVDSEDNELDFELIEKEVGFETPVVFSIEFIRSDISGVDEDLTCPFTVETVPRREVCS